MKHYIGQYNLAIDLLKNEENIFEAIHLLESVYSSSIDCEEVAFALGLAKASVGQVYDALKILHRLENKESRTLIEQIEQHLPTYIHCINIYNSSLKKCKQGERIESLKQMARIMKYGEEIPLPLEMYQLYYYLLTINHKISQFLSSYKKAPSYVKYDDEIYSLFKTYQYRVKARSINHNQIKNLSFITTLVVIIFTFVFLIYFQKPTLPLQANNVADNLSFQSMKSNYEKRIEELENELLHMNKKLQEKMEDIESKSKHIEELENVQKIFNAANLDVKEVSILAGKNLYREGLYLYQSGKLEDAIPLFKRSLAYSANEYFSDDAHFYLINCYIKLNEDEHAFIEMDRFLNKSHETHYHHSPYKDDVMLLKAKEHLKKCEMEEATLLLKTIISNYSGQWTSYSAKNLLKEIQGE